MGRSTHRRRFLTAAAVATTTGLAGCALPSSLDGPESEAAAAATAHLPDEVGLETLVDGLTAPVSLEFADGGDRRYIAQRDGRIAVHEGEGLLEEPLLDLRDAVELGGERGLIGTALHPSVADDRRLFVHYSTARRPGTPADFDHTGVVASFELADDGTQVIRDSERTILEIPQPADFHNGGALAFGPDGYLYVAVGAGGGGGGGGQDVTTDFLGGVLRIDIDDPSNDRPYAVPEDNPLVGREGLDEYYAWGFRNPWRLSFDGDDCFVADVGEDDFEEVNLLERGGNYGWNVKEGTRCYREADCPDEAPDGDRAGDPLIDPIVEYPHEGPETAVTGVSVIGGHVSRGPTFPALEGAYVFGDFVANGRLFAAVEPEAEGDDGTWPTTTLEVAGEATLERILSFGRDPAGNVYVLGTGSDGGGAYRIVPPS